MSYRTLMPCIYKITSPSNKVYIGQTNHFKKRLSHYRNMACKKQPKLYNSLLKHGFDKHLIEIIRICEVHELNELEIFYINQYDSFNSKMGMNLRSGGHESKMTSDGKLKLSVGRTGDKHHNYGKSLSQEWKDKISKANKGRIVSKETRLKISKINTGRKLSKTSKEKISISKKGKIGELCLNSKPVNQYSLDGTLLCTWDSIMNVFRELLYNYRNIAANCRKERRTAYGFVWRYESDKEPFKILPKSYSMKKKILQFDMNGVFLKEWDSAKDAADFLKRNRGGSAINSTCTGRLPHAYGYKWAHKK